MALSADQKSFIYKKIKSRAADLGTNYADMFENCQANGEDLTAMLNTLLIQMPSDEMEELLDRDIFTSASWNQIVETVQLDMHNDLLFGQDVEPTVEDFSDANQMRAF